MEIYPWSEPAKTLREMLVKIRRRQLISEGSLLRASDNKYKCRPLKSIPRVTMKEEETSNPGTIYERVKEDYPKLIVEKGKVFFLDRYTKKYTEAEKGKGYVLRNERNQENPVTIGRESPETRGRKDILLPRKYDRASREHCEIFFDEKGNVCLVDYSLNGTLVNGNRVGGNRVHEMRKLEHEDLIEIPAAGEKIKMTFLTRPRGMGPWVFGEE